MSKLLQIENGTFLLYFFFFPSFFFPPRALLKNPQKLEGDSKSLMGTRLPSLGKTFFIWFSVTLYIKKRK